jgi:hypothetical protein
MPVGTCTLLRYELGVDGQGNRASLYQAAMAELSRRICFAPDDFT